MNNAMMPQPMMNQGMSSGNVLAGLDQKMIKKIFGVVTDTVSQQLSQHAIEAMNSGVPYGHIIDELIKMSPVSAGMQIGQNMSAGGGSGKPPDTGMSNNGGNFKPPQPPNPNPMARDDQNGMAAEAQTTPQNQISAMLTGQVPQQQSQGVGLSGIPTAQDTASRFILPQTGGKGANRIGPNGEFVPGGFFGGALGISPEGYQAVMAGNAMNPANKAQESAVSAAITPASEAEKLTAKGTMANAVIGQENKISEDYTKAMEPFVKANESFNAIKGYYQMPANGVNDLGMAYELIKSFDPNAVKEGELKNLKDTIPYLRKVGIAAKMNGQKFDPATRTQILRAATTKYNSIAKRADSIKQQYSQKVKNYGGSPDRALVDFSGKSGSQGQRFYSKSTGKYYDAQGNVIG